MKYLAQFLAVFALYLASAFAVLPQEDDKGFLTRSIQDALSGAGRTVSIDGFRGALSSAASFDQMTISDDEGVWLTLQDVVLDWNRSALLRGRLEVESLTAARLDLPRLPTSQAEALPDAEAAPFSLPDLPVSIELQEFSIGEINLGAPLLGEAAQLSVLASAQFTDDLGDIDLTATRTDGKRGTFALKANFERSDSVLDLLLRLSEGEEGLAARLLNLPGLPSVEMNVAGSGPIDDFTTDLRIATDGAERLAGQISLGVQEQGRGSNTPDRRVQADIGGDITALLAPRYREFFGENIQLTVDALLEGDGSIDVSTFALNADAVDLRGQVALNADKWPTRIDISGIIANPDGTTILLPVGGDGTRVQGVDLRVDFDAAQDDAIEAMFNVSQLAVTGVGVDQTTLGLSGTLRGAAGSVGTFDGDLRFDASGIALTDAAIAEALGDAVKGEAQISYADGQPIRISGLDLSGADYGLTGQAVINGIETGLSTALDATLTAQDLSRFSALAGQSLSGQTELSLKGDVVPLSGAFDVTATGSTQDLALGIAQADAVLQGTTDLSLAATRDETGTVLRDLVLENAALSLTGMADLRTDNSRAEAQFRLNDLSLVVPQYGGPISVDAVATQDTRGWSVDAKTDGPYGAALTAKGLATGPNARLSFTADVPDMQPFVAEVEGAVTAAGTLRNTAEGWLAETDATGPYDIEAAVIGLVAPKIDIRFDMSMPEVAAVAPQINGPLEAKGTLRQTQVGFEINTQASGPYDVQAEVAGMITPLVDITFDLSLPDVNPLVPQVNGPLAANGTVQQTEQGFVVGTNATGPYGAKAAVEGLATGPDMRLNFDVSMPNVEPLAPGIKGPLDATGVVRQTPDGIAVDTNANGPYGIKAAVDGLATGPNMRMNFDVSMPNVEPLAPGIRGPLDATGSVRQTADGIAVDADANGPYAARASVDGVVTGANANVQFDVAVPNIGALVNNINGPLDVTGSARKQGDAWRLATDVGGPAGTQAQVSGTASESGTLNLNIAGSAPLGLSGPFLAPRDLQGLARFDLQVNGPPALSSVTGTIRTSDASLSAPNLRLALQGIAANINLARSRAQIDVSANGSNGGQVRAGGAVTLTGSLPADIQIGLNELVLIDPRLYKTSLSGQVRLAGPLAGGARIAGEVNVGETTVQVPSTGLTSIGEIPAINHIGATRPVLSTRRKAGIDAAKQAEQTSGSSGPGFGLDVLVNAPNRIFIRGRGLDAEVGGGLRLTGTTNRIISAGRFDLLRGRLSILGQRFDLVEGSTQFQGDLVPYIRFVTSTETSTGEARVIVDGPADAPTVSFEATPDAPQDEVLAQLLFGRNIDEISTFQALQLASAVAELAGRGGVGVISNLRQGFGLDDLDVTTTDSGATAVRAGKYISENVYTDVTAASDGNAEVSLNLDITGNLKGKATLGSDGNSGIGIFFEKDY